MSKLINAGRFCSIIGIGILGRVAMCQAQPSVSGVMETYWLSNNSMRGAVETLTWGELRARISNGWSVRLSGYDFSSTSDFDEAYVRYEAGDGSVRFGRLRTSFGFSDWSELYYNGINHLPLVRTTSLVGNTSLTRDDSGAEASANFGPLQLQAALIQTTLYKGQISPTGIDHATLTAQYGFGQLILGAEVLDQTDASQQIYGANFRYTFPHWLFKGEYFEGVGPNNGSGGYVDATYRLPTKTRTELVGRAEEVQIPGYGAETTLTTLGVRQILNKNLTASVNYGWGTIPTYESYEPNPYSSLTGWSCRVMFQVQF